MLFNRFLAVRFKTAGLVIGGCQLYDSGRLHIPPTIEIDCKHTTSSEPNEATVKIYNVAPETQKRLFVEGHKVELEAGYWPQDGARSTGIVFKGQIREVKTTVENLVDVVSELTLGDHDDAARVRRTKKKHPKGTTHKKIVDDIAADMAADGVTVGSIEVPAYVVPRPVTIERSSWRELDDICVQHDLQWSVQDGVLSVYPSDKPLHDSPVVLRPDTGVLDVPEFTHDGVNLKTMMLPFLRPGHTFVLENPFVKARTREKYKVEEIQFTGSLVGEEFGANITAKVIGADGKVKRSRDRQAGRKV